MDVRWAALRDCDKWNGRGSRTPASGPGARLREQPEHQPRAEL